MIKNAYQHYERKNKKQKQLFKKHDYVYLALVPTRSDKNRQREVSNTVFLELHYCIDNDIVLIVSFYIGKLLLPCR